MDSPLELSYAAPGKEQFPQSSSWRNALYDILSSAEANSEGDGNAIILFRNSKCICTYDKFPKAKHHLLLMCRDYSTNPSCLMNVKSLNDLTKAHLCELREFHNLAKSIAAAISGDEPTSFKVGYHSIPSLLPLHLHIISSDLDSPCITTRKHIVSFSSTFFVTADEVENHLESAFVDSLSVNVRGQRAQDVLDSTPLECQYCDRAALNVPDWKRHNQTCKVKTPNKKERAFNSLLGWTDRDLIENKKAGDRKRTRGDN